MQRFDLSTRERISTQAGAMDLNAGRLQLAESVRLFMYSAAAWVVACVGLVLVVAVWGGSTYEHRALTLLRYLVGALGAGLAALAVTHAGAVTAWFLAEARSYRQRRDAWHLAELRAYRQAGGQVVDRQLTIRALTVQEPTHLVLVALALAERIRQGQAKEPSLAALQGDVWLGRVKVGELSKPAAEEFLRAMHQMGVIKGRTKGKAGQLAAVEPAEVIELVTTRAGRVKALAPAGDDQADGEE